MEKMKNWDQIPLFHPGNSHFPALPGPISLNSVKIPTLPHPKGKMKILGMDEKQDLSPKIHRCFYFMWKRIFQLSEPIFGLF